LSLVNDLLDISKIEAGKMELEIETFHLADVLASSANTIRPLAEKNRNTLQIVAHPSIVMKSDRTKVCQVLINIMSNACKFTEDGNVSLQVALKKAEQGDVAEINISDTGIGMDLQLVERLFDPFVRGDGPSTRRFGGTGLGLAISRKFC